MPRNWIAANTVVTIIASAVLHAAASGNKYADELNDDYRLQGKVCSVGQPVSPADDESGVRAVGAAYKSVETAGPRRHADQFSGNGRAQQYEKTGNQPECEVQRRIVDDRRNFTGTTQDAEANDAANSDNNYKSSG